MITSLKRFKKRKEISARSLIFLFLLALGLAVFILNLNFKIFKENTKTKKELDSLRTEIQKLELEKNNFLIKVSEIKTKEYLEKAGREDFDLKKQGENVVSFPTTEKEQEKK
jgi:cell division protein FtsB